MMHENGITAPINAAQPTSGPCSVYGECDVTPNVTCFTSSLNRTWGGDVVGDTYSTSGEEFGCGGSQWIIPAHRTVLMGRQRPSSESENQKASRELIVNITLVVYTTVFAFGFVGNTLVIIVIIKHSAIRRRSISNYYILNLAVADDLFLLTLPFFCIATYTSNWSFGDATCKLAYVFRESNRFAGLLTLVALTIDRCLATCRSTSRYRRIPVGLAVCAAVWIVSLAASWPYLIHARTSIVTSGSSSSLSCRLEWKQYPVIVRRTWIYSQLVLGLIVPFAVVVSANALLVVRLRRRLLYRLRSPETAANETAFDAARDFPLLRSCSPRRSLPGRQPPRRPEAAAHRAVSMAKLILVIVVVFVGCQLPYHAVELSSLITYERYLVNGTVPNAEWRTWFMYFNVIAQLMVFASSCCNPFVYGIFNSNYRHLYANVLLCRSNDGQPIPATPGVDLTNRDGRRRPRQMTNNTISRSCTAAACGIVVAQGTSFIRLRNISPFGATAAAAQGIAAPNNDTAIQTPTAAAAAAEDAAVVEVGVLESC